MHGEGELVGSVIENMSRLIAIYQQRVRSESYMPELDVDKSDDLISNGKKRVVVLRRLRQEFEDEMNGV